jgi:hypothetical protein
LRQQHKGADDDDDEDERAAAIAESARLSASAASGGGGAAASSAGGGVAFRRMVFITQSPLECTEVVGKMACRIKDWAASPKAPTTTKNNFSKNDMFSYNMPMERCKPDSPVCLRELVRIIPRPAFVSAIVSKRARQSSIVPLTFELGLSCVVLVW